MTTEQKKIDFLNIGLWVAQILLAVTFGWAAFMKLFQSPGQLAEMWPWTAQHAVLVKVTGVIDLLAAIGLIIPGLFRIQRKLTVYVAYGSILFMIAATIFHTVRGEASQTPINIFVAGVAIFIVWGRSKK